MGLLEHARPAADHPWVAPAPGACSCERHAHALADLVIAEVKVGDLLDRDQVLAVRADELFIQGSSGVRRGPYEWRLLCSAEVEDMMDPHAPTQVEHMLFIQPGITNVLRLDRRTLAVGAPTLCELGVVAAFVTALAHPSVRSV